MKQFIMMRKTTILAPMLGIDPESGLGGAIMDYEVLTGLAARGHRIILILPEGEWAPEGQNIEVIYLKKRWFHRLLIYKYNWLFIPAILNVLRITHVDVIRIHSPYGVGIGVALLKFLRFRLPLCWISYLHLEDKILWKTLDMILPRFMDIITTISRDSRTDLMARCPELSENEIAVIPCGTDSDLFRPSSHADRKKPERGFDIDDIILLFIGQIIPRKGLDTLMESWRLLNERSNTHLLIIGKISPAVRNTPFARGLLEAISSDNTIHHIPHVSKEELPEIYSLADIFVFPSRLEGFGMVVAEAMSCCLPVVATACKAVREIVQDGITGYLTPVGDAQAFAERIDCLIRDQEKRKKMGSAGRDHIIQYYTWEATLSLTEHVLREHLSNSANHSQNA